MRLEALKWLQDGSRWLQDRSRKVSTGLKVCKMALRWVHEGSKKISTSLKIGFARLTGPNCWEIRQIVSWKLLKYDKWYHGKSWSMLKDLFDVQRPYCKVIKNGSARKRWLSVAQMWSYWYVNRFWTDSYRGCFYHNIHASKRRCVCMIQICFSLSSKACSLTVSY